MSHKISVEGNFGSPDSLKKVLAARNVQYNVQAKDGQEIMTFPDARYNRWNNPLQINLTSPTDSVMDADIADEVAEWYRDAQKDHTLQQILMQGHTVASQTYDSVTKEQVIRFEIYG